VQIFLIWWWLEYSCGSIARPNLDWDHEKRHCYMLPRFCLHVTTAPSPGPTLDCFLQSSDVGRPSSAAGSLGECVKPRLISYNGRGFFPWSLNNSRAYCLITRGRGVTKGTAPLQAVCFKPDLRFIVQRLIFLSSARIFPIFFRNSNVDPSDFGQSLSVMLRPD